MWHYTSAGWLNNLCFNIVVMAGITTLIFNANPLMKFDGYYILSDLLDIPNLSVNGNVALRHWLRRYLLGVESTLPPWRAGTKLVIGVYGVAALVWRVVVCVGLVITAATMFQGAGVLAATAAVVLWLGPPLRQFAKYLLNAHTRQRARFLRIGAMAGVASALVVTIATRVPFPGARTAPAIVEYSDCTVVRASSPGFVRDVRVLSGQQVTGGQCIAVLENHDLVKELSDLKLRMQQSELRCRQWEQQGKLAACQAEMETLQDLRSKVAEKADRVDDLIIRAPHAGKIIGRNLDTLTGTYLAEGAEVISLADENAKELRVAIAQDDLSVFVRQIGRPVRVDMPGYPYLTATLSGVIPRALRQPTHPALTALNGGPLPVQPSAAPGSSTKGETFELLAPRFTGNRVLQPRDRPRTARRPGRHDLLPHAQRVHRRADHQPGLPVGPRTMSHTLD